MEPNHTVLADFLRNLAFTWSEREISHWRVWCTETAWLDTCLKRWMIILLEIFWGGNAEWWVESYCNNQGRADDTFNWSFCVDTVLSLLPFTLEVSWVQTQVGTCPVYWVSRWNAGHLGGSVLILWISLYPRKYDIKRQIKSFMTGWERYFELKKKKSFSCFVNKGLYNFILHWAPQTMWPNLFRKFISVV